MTRSEVRAAVAEDRKNRPTQRPKSPRKVKSKPVEKQGHYDIYQVMAICGISRTDLFNRAKRGEFSFYRREGIRANCMARHDVVTLKRRLRNEARPVKPTH